MIDPCEPGNIVARPIMLKYAAVAEMLKAEISVKIESVIIIYYTSFKLCNKIYVGS